MNIQNLRYFAIAAKLENVSKTAELMHTSQSAVSKNISALEDEFGVKLFDRLGKRLVLNDAGRRFLQSCDRILEEADTVSKDLRNMSVGGDNSIRICAISINPNMFSCLSMFKLSYSEVEYRIDTLTDSYDMPDINDYDLILYPDEVRFRKFKGYDFSTEKYYFAVRTDNPFAGKASISVSMMDDLPFVFLKHDLDFEYPFHVCLAQNVRMAHVHYVDSRLYHLQLIANGIAVGFVPEGSAEIYKNDKRIRLLHLTDDRFSRPVKACFKREKHLSELAGVFKEHFLNYFDLREE